MTQVLNANGEVVDPRTISRVRELARMNRASALGGGSVPYDAASITSQETGEWNAWLGSPDWETTPYRDRIVARIRDLVRNDGWASGSVTSVLDSTIGGDFRLMAKPDHRALALFDPAFDSTWADEFARTVQSLWRGYAYDPGRWCDATRRMTVPQMFRLAFRHELVDGEALAILPWARDRRGIGRASSATCMQLIDPDRLSNPGLSFDTANLRGGVEIDAYGAAVAYHIRRAHPGDWFEANKAFVWDRVPRETSFGRPIVIHHFESDRAGQHRPAGGMFTPILARLKMLAKYDQVELQAAVINAIFAAYIESPFDRDLVADSLGGEMSGFQADRLDYQKEARLSLGGAVLPVLYPGDKLQVVNAARPSSQYDAFQHAFLRNAAAVTGQSAEQVSKDWSKTNYSSARGALVEAWKTLGRRRQNFAIGFASPFYGAWLEEQMDRGLLPLPAGAPDFIEARAAYSACRWMGPARGWIDPVKERQGEVLAMNAGLSTLEMACAEQGLDWEEVLEQRKVELQRFEALGLPKPEWFGAEPQYKDEVLSSQQ